MPSESLEISFELHSIQAAAQQLLTWAKTARVFTFSGSLGAGKTTFIRALCDVLGVADTVSSPTFALINEYVFREGIDEQRILHMDWYRLKDEEEALNAGMEDALQSEVRYCFVEWPEKASGLLHMPHISVSITQTETAARLLTATCLGV